MSYFDDEINSINSEILALKQERQKTLSQLTIAETTLEITTQSSVQYKIAVKPKNNVIPIITAYVEMNTPPNYNLSFGNPEIDEDDDEFIVYYYLYQDSGSNKTVQLTFCSTSELEITV